MASRCLVILVCLLAGTIRPAAADRPDDRAFAVEAFMDVIRMLVHPDRWQMLGGDSVMIDSINDAIVIQAIDGTPEAKVIARQAESMIARLAEEIVEVRDLPGDARFTRLPPDATLRSKLHTTPMPWAGETLSLGETLRIVRQRTHRLIFVDWDTLLLRSGVAADTPVTMPAAAATVDRTLEHVLSQLGRGEGDERVKHVVRDAVVLVSSVGALAPDRPLVIYDVRPVPLPAADVAERIREMIHPDGWVVNGGDEGMILELHGRLLITETAPHHAQIAALIRYMRATVRAATSPAP